MRRKRLKQSQVKYSLLDRPWWVWTGGAALVFVLAILVGLLANLKPASQPLMFGGGDASVSGPVAVSEQVKDFGRVPLDKTVSHAFRLRNVSQETVRVGKVEIETLEGC